MDLNKKERRKIELYKRKISNDLYKKVFPIINPLTNQYFNKKFIDEAIKEVEIHLDPDYFIEGRIESNKGENKWTMILGPSNFLYSSINGKGIHTVLHEYSHIGLFNKLSYEKYKSLNLYLKESFCDYFAYEIINISDNPKLREAKEYAEKYHNMLTKNRGEMDILDWLHFKDKIKKEYPYITDEWRLAYRYFYYNKKFSNALKLLCDENAFQEFVDKDINLIS